MYYLSRGFPRAVFVHFSLMWSMECRKKKNHKSLYKMPILLIAVATRMMVML